MLLDDYLKESGKNKTGLAKELGLSKPALSKWVDIPERWMVVLYPQKNRKSGTEYSMDEIRALCKMRVDHSDEDIAVSVGLASHEFYGMIERLRQHGLAKGYEQVEDMKDKGTWPPPCIVDGTLEV